MEWTSTHPAWCRIVEAHSREDCRRADQMTITTVFSGPECDGERCDDYEHRPECSLYDDSAQWQQVGESEEDYFRRSHS